MLQDRECRHELLVREAAILSSHGVTEVLIEVRHAGLGDDLVEPGRRRFRGRYARGGECADKSQRASYQSREVVHPSYLGISSTPALATWDRPSPPVLACSRICLRIRGSQ